MAQQPKKKTTQVSEYNKNAVSTLLGGVASPGAIKAAQQIPSAGSTGKKSSGSTKSNSKKPSSTAEKISKLRNISSKPMSGVLNEVVITDKPIIKQKIGTERLTPIFDFGGENKFSMPEVIKMAEKVKKTFGENSEQYNYLMKSLGQKGQLGVFVKEFRKPDLMMNEKHNVDTAQRIAYNPTMKSGPVKDQLISFFKSSGLKPVRDLSKDKDAKNTSTSKYGGFVGEEFFKK